jgi:hypothetical protein
MEVCDESRIHKRKSEGPVPTGRKKEGQMLENLKGLSPREGKRRDRCWKI